MKNVDRLLEHLFRIIPYPGDINEHLLTLCDYAKHSRVICELGVSLGSSTTALSVGLLSGHQHHALRYEDDDYKHKKPKLICVDVKNCSDIYPIRLARELGLDLEFIQEDSAKIDLPPVDLLFIDSWHCYGHLKRELIRHSPKVRKHIILHDTSVYNHISCSVAAQLDLIELSEKSGYSIDEIYRGLGPALEEFLIENPQWELEMVHTHNHGLTILKRKDLH